MTSHPMYRGLLIHLKTMAELRRSHFLYRIQLHTKPCGSTFGAVIYAIATY